MFFDGFEDLLSADHQFFAQKVTIIVDLTILQIIHVTFALCFEHHPQCVEIRLLEYGGRHAENGAD